MPEQEQKNSMRCRKAISFHFENGLISNGNTPRRSKRDADNTKVAINKKNTTEAKLKASIEKGSDWIEITMPIFTVSEANGGAKRAYKRNGKTCYKSEHWTDKHRRHKLQKGTVFLLLRPHRSSLTLPCSIKLTRFAPDKLDRFDNLPMALKWVLDAVCEIVTGDNRPGRADAHSGIVDVTYSQVESKEYGIKVRIEKTN